MLILDAYTRRLYLKMDVCTFQTRSSGNCLFHAFKGCMRVRHSGDKQSVYFPCRYLRRMVVAWMAHNRCCVLKHKLVSLQSKYGIEDGDYVPNPISYREYLKMMLKRSTWGEDVVLHSLASLFDLRITVYNSASREEYRYRHDLPLHRADVVLIYNGHNHYLYAGKWTLIQYWTKILVVTTVLDDCTLIVSLGLEYWTLVH